MPRKIYDIFPPDIKKREVCVSVTPKRKSFKFFPKFSLNSRKSAFFAIAGLLIFIIASHTLFLNAEIIIHPQTEEISYIGKAKITPSVVYFDLEEKLIPGEFFEIKEEGARTFFSSGIKAEEKKAEGTLKVYNNYSALPQILVANTRFISDNGKLFYSLERISIPGRRQEGGRTVPGEKSVAVVAAEAGDEYNIGKNSKFSVPGLQGTPMYTAIYAENLTPISGGYIGQLPYITENDTKQAQEILIADLLNQARLKFKEEISEDFVVNLDLMNWNIMEESIYPGVGENSEVFEYSIKIDLKVFSYKNSHLEEMAKKLLLSQTDKEIEEGVFSLKKIYEKSLKIDSEAEFLGLEKKEAVLFFEISALVYSEIKENDLKNMLSGKSFKEAELILTGYEAIDEVQIKHWPFWTNKMPGSDKMKVTIRVNE